MTVEFLRPWGHFAAGQVVIDMPDGMANEFILRTIARQKLDCESRPDLKVEKAKFKPRGVSRV